MMRRRRRGEQQKNDEQELGQKENNAVLQGLRATNYKSQATSVSTAGEDPLVGEDSNG
jgi:hypothetical protein